MFIEVVKIPKKKVGVLDSARIKDIEAKLDVKLSVDNEGNVTIEGESLNLLNAKNIIKAIARGFSPETAELLLKEDYILDVIDVTDFTGKSKDAQTRLKGRVIGRQGQARARIEKVTNTSICIYGKTVSILGPGNSVYSARRAVIMLLEGSTHAKVSRYLENAQNELKRDVIKGFYV